MSLVRLLEKKCKKTLFTTPSHGQKNGIYQPLSEMYKIDISETECYQPQEELERAQLWARAVYQTYSTTFLILISAPFPPMRLGKRKKLSYLAVSKKFSSFGYLRGRPLPLLS